MFGRSKKKKENTRTAEEEHQSQEYKAFAADFLAEEADILAITGPAALNCDREGDSGLWHVCVHLTAWMDEYTRELRREEVLLEAAVDDKLMTYLRTQIFRDSIISVTVRPSADGSRFLMTDLPKPGYDLELDALLEEQKKPVTLEAEGLGTFTLNRALGWFETAADWMGSEISLTFDQGSDADAALDAARALLAGQEEWNVRVRAYAAAQLLDQCAQEGGASLTQESFGEQLELESILTGSGGTFEFWFHDADLRTVHVTGTLEQGPLQAQMEE